MVKLRKVTINFPDNHYRFLQDLGTLDGSTAEDMIESYTRSMVNCILGNMNPVDLELDRVKLLQKYDL